MIVHTNSWHYKLLNFYDVNTYELTDSCKYTRKVMTVTGFSVFVFAFLMMTLGDFIAWAIVCITSGYISPNLGTVFVLILCSVVLLVAACAVLGESYLIWKHRRPHKPAPPPSFAKQAYRQWRDKFCTEVEVTRD